MPIPHPTNVKNPPEHYKDRSYPYEEWMFDMYWDAVRDAEREWRIANGYEENEESED